MFEITNVDIRKVTPDMMQRMSWGEYQKRRDAKARIYVHPEGENILQNLENRHQRPYTLYRKHVIPHVLRAMGLPSSTKARWSQRAGCSCPCSPGFIVDDMLGTDVFVTIR